MTELQLRYPMPHASLDRSLHAFSHVSNPPHSKYDQPLLPLPQQQSTQPSLSDAYPALQRFAADQLTPPLDMSASHSVGGYNGGYSNSRTGEPSGAARVMEPDLYSDHKTGSWASASQYGTRSRGPASPVSVQPNLAVPDNSHRRTRSSNAIAPSLQIPRTISTPQGGMPQLAAEVTCLFWFENSSLLEQVLESRYPNLPVSPLSPDALPTTGFRKWVATILSTTQVAQNVILLALLFIYRLKKTNPNVKGKPGSEYRLLTVALMLGNKFLDDNTYTNKTWAEVSGISVQEVHIMEVEFLSNMRYSLFTSEEEWKEWHITLGKFGTFFDKASRMPLDVMPRALGPPTPTLHMPPTLPSPPQSTHASPPFLHTYSPNHQAYANAAIQLPQVSSATISPIGPLPELDLRPTGRKRSYDDQAQEPPPKRQYRSFTQTPSNSSGYVPPASAPAVPRLPLPNLSIPSTASTPQSSMQNVPQLPPPGNRAMSLVYPAPTQQWSYPHSNPATTAPVHPLSQSVTASAVDDSLRQLSPFPGSGNSSPVNAHFPAMQSNRPSPSLYLSQRQSPYRPVRSVHTLLVPPPSGSLHNQPANIGDDQMQYQPLGRRTERRAGLLPYMHRDAWPETNQFNQLPILPQPNFGR